MNVDDVCGERMDLAGDGPADIGGQMGEGRQVYKIVSRCHDMAPKTDPMQKPSRSIWICSNHVRPFFRFLHFRNAMYRAQWKRKRPLLGSFPIQKGPFSPGSGQGHVQRKANSASLGIAVSSVESVAHACSLA